VIRVGQSVWASISTLLAQASKTHQATLFCATCFLDKTMTSTVDSDMNKGRWIIAHIQIRDEPVVVDRTSTRPRDAGWSGSRASQARAPEHLMDEPESRFHYSKSR
jgi:hypothetical protein